jgi:hypothetical protein
LRAQRDDAQVRLGKAQEQVGGLREVLKARREALDELDRGHAKWSACTPEMIQEMRNNAQALADDVSRLRRHLGQATALDLRAMRNEIARLLRQMGDDRRVIEHWDRTATAVLIAMGLSKGDLEEAFRIANPALLNLVLGETLTIRDKAAVLERLRGIARRIKDNRYEDGVIEAALEHIDGPALHVTRDKEQLRHRIHLTEQDLADARERLKVSEGQEMAQRRLQDQTQELERQRSQLSQYDQYVQRWAQRGQLEQQIAATQNSISETERTVVELQKAIELSDAALLTLQRETNDLDQLEDRLKGFATVFRQEISSLGIEVGPYVAGEREESGQDDSLPAINASVEAVRHQLQGATSDAHKAADLRRQLHEMEAAITKQSNECGIQPIYFSDRDEDWKLLIDRRESTTELERVAKKNWEDLFTTLGARLDGIKRGLRSIENAVQRINNGLKTYRVSNLREVQLKVEKEQFVCQMIDDLTAQDSIFLNRDQIDLAKQRLHRMITTGQLIELPRLFALHIRVQQNDEQWLEAKSLDDIGSTGTGMTAKAMIFIQLVRAIVANERYGLHFYLDETGQLDDMNLHATTAMAVSKGMMPITAEPDVRLEPLAHPEVTVYSLGLTRDGLFYIDRYKTYHARLISAQDERVGATDG